MESFLDPLSLFGLFSVSSGLVCYALENRSPWFIFGFSFSSALCAIYGFLQGAWPFGLIEIFWTIVAFKRWWSVTRAAKATPSA